MEDCNAAVLNQTILGKRFKSFLEAVFQSFPHLFCCYPVILKKSIFLVEIFPENSKTTLLPRHTCIDAQII